MTPLAILCAALAAALSVPGSGGPSSDSTRPVGWLVRLRAGPGLAILASGSVGVLLVTVEGLRLG